MTDSDIVFITNHRSTKWLEWSQRSIQRFFPNSKRLTIDGSTNWPNVWFHWLEELKTRKEKYFVMIDEDCFLLNRDGLLLAFEKMENEGSAIAGCPDSFYEMRGFNEIALNPFFMIGDIAKTLSIFSRVPNWRSLRFDMKYFDKPKPYYSWNPKTKVQDMRFLNYEPFYCFFWAILESGNTISYLYPRVNDEFRNEQRLLPATSVRVMSDTPDFALHMWYSRQWNDAKNISRYTKLEQFLPIALQ